MERRCVRVLVAVSLALVAVVLCVSYVDTDWNAVLGKIITMSHNTAPKGKYMYLNLSPM